MPTRLVLLLELTSIQYPFNNIFLLIACTSLLKALLSRKKQPLEADKGNRSDRYAIA